MLNKLDDKPVPNATKAGETRWLDATFVMKAGRSQFHQGELTGQAPLEQPSIWDVSRQENILTSLGEKF